MSGGGPCGPHKLALRHQGVGGGGRACGPLVWPLGQLSGPVIFKNSRKNHTKFSGPSENFYFRGIFLRDAKTEDRKN